MRTFTASVLAALTLTCNLSAADEPDWSQWRGPNRDGHAAKQELLQTWPDGGPKVKWDFKAAGRGYSSVAVADGRLYTMGTQEDGCYVYCLDAQTGKQIWQRKFAAKDSSDDYNHGWGGGPRSTPTIDADQVFVLSDLGVLASLDKETGAVQWTADFVKEHGGKVPAWGYSESPLVDGDRVMVTPGGDAFMIGVDRSTGSRVWTSKGYSSDAQYVSIMRGEIGGKSYYVTASKKGLVAFDVGTGAKLFEDSATANKVAVIPTPILTDDQIYHSSAYGAGNTLLKLSEDDGAINAKSVYALQGKTMENHHGGTVLVDGIIYGFTKANGGNWMAQDLSDGQTLWEEKIRPNRSGSICYADGRLYCYNDKDGTVFLVTPSKSGWQPNGMLTLPKQTEIPRDRGAIWAHPVIANQTLFIRDQDLIYAFDIAR
jgi:outer membrane protein assembly factor BamB